MNGYAALFGMFRVLKAHCGLCLTGEKVLPLYLGIEAALPTSSCFSVIQSPLYKQLLQPLPAATLSIDSTPAHGAGQGASLKLYLIPPHLLPSGTWAPASLLFQPTKQSRPSGRPALPNQQTSLVPSESPVQITAENRLT